MPDRKHIETAVSPEQLEIIDAKARSLALSRAEYLRRSALGQDLRTRAEEELYRELVRLGLKLKALQAATEHSALEDLAVQIRQALKQATAK